MGAIRHWVLASFAIGLLLVAATLSFIAIGILAVSRVMGELGAALYQYRKNER